MRTLLAALIVACFVAGCGQKGPLYFPDSKPPPKAPAKPAQQSGTDDEAKRQAQ